MDIVDRIDMGNGLELRIIPDGDAMNPRKEFDSLSVMALFHRRYDLGDKDLTIKDKHGEYHTIDKSDYSSWDDMESDLQKRFDIIVIIPVYMYEHSGITIRHYPFDCHWDSGQIGFAFVTREIAKKEYGRLTKKTIETIRNYIIGEIELYDSYLRGDVYGYVLVKTNPMEFETLGSVDNTEQEIDSCWGFYGNDYKTNGILDSISGYLKSGNKGDMDVSNRL